MEKFRNYRVEIFRIWKVGVLGENISKVMGGGFLPSREDLGGEFLVWGGAGGVGV